MYSNLPNLIIGFHGCDSDTYEKVLYKHERLVPSHNSYDWLGNGIYFWENSLARAEGWVGSYCGRYNGRHPGSRPKKPAVIGAVISLGHCLDLTDYGSSDILKTGYAILKLELSLIGRNMPENRNINGSRNILPILLPPSAFYPLFYQKNVIHNHTTADIMLISFLFVTIFSPFN